MNEPPAVTRLVKNILDPHTEHGITFQSPSETRAPRATDGLLRDILGGLENVTSPNSSGFYRARCPYCGRDDDFSLNEYGFRCFAASCEQRGELRELAAHLGLEGADEYESPVPEPT